MKLRTIFLTLALALFGAQLCSAQDNNLGTWKLNEAKSKIPAGMSHVVTSSYEAQGDQIKAVGDGVDASGSPMHAEWVGKFDGKDYPVTGTGVTNSRSYKQVNANTLFLTNKKDSKTVSTARIVTSADGKTRTVHITQTDSAGKKLSGTAVYDRQ
jgi:hypothetical protein